MVFVLLASINRVRLKRNRPLKYLQHNNNNTMLNKLLQFIAPDDCINCGAEGLMLCDWCRLDMEALPSRCFYCQKITEDFNTCNNCRPKTKVKRVYITNEYKDLAKTLVNALKYKSKRQASIPIARIMTDQLPYLGNDFIVASLPTTPSRVRQRGFDHTMFIAKEIARQKNLKYRKVLRKTDNSRQVGSSRAQRLKQAEGAYMVTSPKRVEGKKVLLVDDVVTTGASLNAAISELKKAGAIQVYATVFAYTK